MPDLWDLLTDYERRWLCCYCHREYPVAILARDCERRHEEAPHS